MEDVAVVVVGYNDGRWIKPCLQSVLEDVPPSCIYYVDNASKDGSGALVSDLFPDVQILLNSVNRGFAGANNQVLRELTQGTRYRYVFLLNPDTLIPKGLISGLREFMDRFPEYGIVGPLQMEYDMEGVSDRLNRVSRRDIEIGKYHILRRWLPEFSLQVDDRHPDGVLGVYYIQGAAFFARLDLFRDIGYFDEIYHAFFEEVDLCRRALWRGYKLGLVMGFRLWHASRGADGGSDFRIYYRIRNKYLFVLTDPDLHLRSLPLILVRLLAADLRRNSMFSASSDFSTKAFVQALLWLLINGHEVVRGRSRRTRFMASEGSSPW
jgi:GT2 family glycosyltransferase